MNHYRRITSLQEDFQALGILNNKQTRGDTGFSSEKPVVENRDIENDLELGLDEEVDLDQQIENLIEDYDNQESSSTESLTEDYDPTQDDDDLTEAKDDFLEEDEEIIADMLAEDESLTEAIARQRLKRMSPSDRAKARRERKKKKSIINRMRRRRMKQSAFKIRQKRLKQLKGKRTAGSRRRFVLKQSMGESVELLESLKDLDLELSENVDHELNQAFENIDVLAGSLSRKFCVAEEIMDQLRAESELPVEHPPSEYGYDKEPDNIKDGGKTGDATDSAKDAPKGNVAHKDDHPDNPTKKGNVKFEADSCGDDDDDDDDDDEYGESIVIEDADLGSFDLQIVERAAKKKKKGKAKASGDTMSNLYKRGDVEDPEALGGFLKWHGSYNKASGKYKQHGKAKGNKPKIGMAKSHKESLAFLNMVFGENYDFSDLSENDVVDFALMIERTAAKKKKAKASGGDTMGDLYKRGDIQDPEAVGGFLRWHGSYNKATGKYKKRGKAKGKKNKPKVGFSKKYKEDIDLTNQELTMIRMEAQDAMDNLKTHVISPKEAGTILRDMVGYLGGAMKTYMDLARNIGKYAYAGVGAPPPNTEMIRNNVSQQGHNYIGRDDLDSEPASPEVYRQRT